MPSKRVELASLAEGYVQYSLRGRLYAAEGAQIALFKHGTGTAATVYANETGEATIAQPFASGEAGRIPGWVASGARLDYEITFNGKTIKGTTDPRAADEGSGEGTGGGLSEGEVEGLVLAGPYDPSVLTSKINALGSVSGTVTPNLNSGHVVKFTATGAVKVKKPTNWPSAGRVTYVEYRWKQDATGARKVDIEIDDWEGQPLTFDEAANAPNSVVLLSDDGGTTIFALGGEAGGLSKEEVESIVSTAISALPLALTSAEIEALANGRIAALAMLLSEKPGFALRPTTHLLTAASGSIARDTFNRITKNGSTWAMAAFVGSPHDGELTIVENGATAAVNFEVGALGGGAQTFIMEPGEIIVLIGDVTAAAAESLAPRDRLFLRYKPNGPYTAYAGLTLVAGKVEQGTGYAHGARLEANGTSLRLRGVLKVKAGKPVAAAEKFATLPSSSMFPTSTVMKTGRNAATGAAIAFTINTAGELKPVAIIAEAVEVSFDDTSTTGI